MEISIESPQLKFTEHLDQPSNNRILFSGKFGTGKSYFLKKYFKEHEDKYNLFWISPVNYVVGANKDIFEWIKVDIAKELLSKSTFSEESEKISKNLLIQTYLYQNSGAIFSKLLAIIANKKIEKLTGIDFLKEFKKELDTYKEFEQANKVETESEWKELVKIIDDSIQIQGSIFEDDLTTQLLRTCIKTLGEETRKENVLVIDDLDRLDPEHIFRILNILSVHNDHFDSNKFGFEKVIVVCDYENIEQLYHYRYGPKSDFGGYIEKFYSYEPFIFSIKRAVMEYCNRFERIQGLDQYSQSVMNLLLALFVKNKLIKIRSLKKISFPKQIIDNLNFKSDYYSIGSDPMLVQEVFTQNTSFKIDYNSFSFLKVVYLISLVFGGIDRLKIALATLSQKPEVIPANYFQDIINALATLSNLSKGDGVEIFYKITPDNYRSLQDYPELIFADKNYIIQLQWTRDKKYDGKENYFNNSVVKQNVNKQNSKSTQYSKPHFM